MYWNKSEKRRKNDKMAQVALNQKHNTIGREKRRWKRQKNDKLRRLEQKNRHKTKKLTWKNKEETEEKCWKQFYNIRFLKCGYKKKKKNRLQAHEKHFWFSGKGACDCKKSSRSLEAPGGDASLRRGQLHPPRTLCLSGLSKCGMRSREEASCLNVFEEHKQRQGLGRAGPTTLYFGPGRAGDSERVMQLVSPAGSRKFL